MDDLWPVVSEAADSSSSSEEEEGDDHTHINLHRHTHTLTPPHRCTVTGADVLPAVLRGDVTGSGGGKMAQSVSRQEDGVPAAWRQTAVARTPGVARPEDVEARRVLDTRYNTYKEFNSFNYSLKETFDLVTWCP